MAAFLLGINYWPRSSAMAMWRRFDAGEIDEDFARIAALGLHVVRFFLQWEDFQPKPDTIDRNALDRFDAVVALARKHGLQTMPTFFTGHMSGCNWLPGWTLERGRPSGRFRTISGGKDVPFGIADFYTGALLEAQRLHVWAVAERHRDDPAIHSWDLGNEFSNLRAPAWPAAAARWSAVLAQELQSASNRPVTAGTHGEDLTEDRNIRPSSLCESYAFATMHGYSVYSAFARDRLDADVVPFLGELMRACAGKRVLLSEFGNPTCPPGTRSPGDRVALPGEHVAAPQPDLVADGLAAAAYACLSEEEMADYARAVLDRLQTDGSLGAFWWCWADYAAELAATPPFDRAPHEMSFGIVRNDGSEKPVCAALSAFAAERRDVVRTPVTLTNESAYYADLPASTANTYARYVERATRESGRFA